jgi:hypothetical protein
VTIDDRPTTAVDPAEEARWREAEAGGQPDREQTLADMEAAGQVYDDPGESDHDDSEAPRKKERIPMEDFARKGWSDEEEAINIEAILHGYTERAGTIDVSVIINLTAEATPELSSRLTEVVQTQTFSAHYVGKDLGVGVTVDKFTVSGDADGNKEAKIAIRLPETQRKKLKNIVGLARTKGVFALVPEQLELDLTTRAE